LSTAFYHFLENKTEFLKPKSDESKAVKKVRGRAPIANSN